MHLWSLTLSLSLKHTHTHILSLFLGQSANVVCTQETMSDREKRERERTEMKVGH